MSGAPDLFGSSEEIYQVQTHAHGPPGRLPLTEEQLLNSPSGDLFGLSQNAGMGWKTSEVGRRQFLILSTQGGVRAANGEPIALGYHTGHWEIGLLARRGCAHRYARSHACLFRQASRRRRGMVAAFRFSVRLGCVQRSRSAA